MTEDRSEAEVARSNEIGATVVGRSAFSVVVPTRDRPGMLSGCLRALRDDLGSGDEIVVVDSASADPATVARLARECRARLVRLDRPGASAARNAGWRAVTHEIVGFVDDDVRVTSGWADAVVAAFTDDDVDFVTGGVGLPAHQLNAERPVAVTSRTVRQALHPGLDGDLGASANLAVRRSALVAVDGFDERLGPGTWAASAEDLDLLDRMFSAGLRGVYEPAAWVEHEQWRTRRQLVALDWGYGKGMGVRLARLARADPPRSRRLLRESVVEQGLQPMLRDLRHGYEFGALTVGTRTLATVLGRLVGAMSRSRKRHQL